MLTVNPFTGDWREWDALVLRHPDASHYHLSGWREIICQLYGHECIYLAAHDTQGELCGVLPLVHLNSKWFGDFLVSMPFLNAGGPIGTSQAVRALAHKAAEIAEDSGMLLELRSRVPLPISLCASHRKITSILPLQPDQPEAIWRSLPSKVRNQVRRPQRLGMEVLFGHDQLTSFFKIFSKHMSELGTPTQPRKLFELVTHEFPEDVWFGCVYHGKEGVAGGCAIRWRGELEMVWASSLSSFNPLGPNMLLYWSFMERAARHGIRSFNFGRCTPGSNTHRFKRQWGAQDVRLWWYSTAASSNSNVIPSADNPAYVWKKRLWQRLPVPVATTLGPHIVRYIP